MRPEQWNPPIELSKKEEKIVKLIKRAKLFTFLRSIRHLLFDETFQDELSKMYAEADKGHPPVPPAQLALTTILQAYTGASDAEAAAKVEDTYNLLGHALKKALSVIARQQGRELTEIADQMEAAQQIEAQDVEVDEQGEVKLRCMSGQEPTHYD
jgi:hypothetical protein